MRIAEHANLRIGNRKTIRAKEQRVGLEAARRRRAQGVDILECNTVADARNRDL